MTGADPGPEGPKFGGRQPNPEASLEHLLVLALAGDLLFAHPGPGHGSEHRTPERHQVVPLVALTHRQSNEAGLR